jgi:hypothetical protein
MTEHHLACCGYQGRTQLSGRRCPTSTRRTPDQAATIAKATSDLHAEGLNHTGTGLCTGYLEAAGLTGGAPL